MNLFMLKYIYQVKRVLDFINLANIMPLQNTICVGSLLLCARRLRPGVAIIR